MLKVFRLVEQRSQTKKPTADIILFFAAIRSRDLNICDLVNGEDYDEQL